MAQNASSGQIIGEISGCYSLRSKTQLLDVQNKLNRMEIKKW